MKPKSPGSVHLKLARQSEVGTVNHVDHATCGEQPGEDLRDLRDSSSPSWLK